jgi:cytochrome c oxidase subunit 2
MTERGRLRLAGVVLLAMPVLLLAACGENLPQDSLRPEGPAARTIDSLFRPVFWIAVAVFVLVEGLLVFALIRFRHKPGRGVPLQVHGNKRLEIAWTIVPAVLLAGIAVPTIGTIFALSGRPAGNVLDISITGHQWWWEIEYPGMNVITANEVNIPVGRPVYITLNSEDVIHSFWVPRLAGKQDLQPGRTNYLRIEAEKPGVYLGQCAEFCGVAHADMRFRVIARTPADFDAWVEQQLQPAAAQPPPDASAAMSRAGCANCHTINGLEGFGGKLGPDLTHFGGRDTFAAGILESTPENLADWLRDPQAIKPGNDMTIGPNSTPGRSVLTEEEIDALIAYLEELE